MAVDMTILVYGCGLLILRGAVYRCALGRSGIAAAKQEGDGATPVGRFRLRGALYRRDRIEAPECALPMRPIEPTDGWSDDSDDPEYNRRVRLPHKYRHERLWRDDRLYDLVVPLGYNDDPAVPGLGSAIFLHVAAPDFSPTEGCIALAAADLRGVLAQCGPDTDLVVMPRR